MNSIFSPQRWRTKTFLIYLSTAVIAAVCFVFSALFWSALIWSAMRDLL